MLEIVRLRARRAELLGYRTHADYVIAGNRTRPRRRRQAAHRAGRVGHAGGSSELARLTELAGGAIGPADVTYWLAQERKAKAPVDLSAFTDYCELDRVLNDGVFYAAGVLYGLRFTPRPDLHGYHPDVRVWEVHDEAGTGVGLYLGDFYARPSKRGGAWMNSIVDQSAALRTPVIVNVLNLTKPDAGEPCLLSTDQLTTLFHEFGHTLHGLLSSVEYPSQSGTSVPRDFVEFPSQVNEMWVLHSDVLAHYARHLVPVNRFPSNWRRPRVRRPTPKPRTALSNIWRRRCWIWRGIG